MKKSNFIILMVLIAGAINFSLVGPGFAADKWPSTITLGSFVKGSAAYPVNVGLAKLITKYTPATAAVREFGGGAPGLEAMARGDSDTWGVGQNEFYHAYFGTATYAGKPKNIRLLIGAVYNGSDGLGIRPNEGIKALKDLAGKRCLFASNLIFHNEANKAIMEKAGVWDSIKLLKFLSTDEIATAMIEKKADAFIWSVGASYTLQIKQSVGIDWISLSEDEVAPALQIPGVISWTASPQILKMYDYPPDKILRTYAYVFAIAVRPEMPDDVAYGILDAIYSGNHINEVMSLSEDFKDTILESAAKHFWLPFHAGAVNYFKAKGVWTPEMDAKQKGLLAKRGFAK